ncbi:hypothetical protein [Acidithiobacillus sp. AMEEHan]|uniref:hypothetical protein n=1 Tax=Acidithiobacillus sp. AMEEHan TaxID=2994951 RepID=UPI0027E58A8A|nr:hypothetical protein [Acidithiobacillus sp. AMEEHan]
MTIHDRREPVLDEEELPEGTEPLLLQDLVREGLPPPLWRRTTHSPEKMPREEGPAPAVGKPSIAADPSAPPYAELGTAHQQTESAESMEETELAKALEKIRHMSFRYPAQAGPESPAPEPVAAFSGQVAEPSLERTVPPAAETLPSAEDSGSFAAPSDAGTAMENHDLSAVPPDIVGSASHTEALEAIGQTATAPSDNSDNGAAKSAAATPSPSLFDGDFLRQFETLLFQEVERRIVAELEEKITQHLQKAWKEQVSLAIMRSLALEGIRLRETVAQEIRGVLPEILQRVLHEGLDEALTPSLGEDVHPSTDS